MPTFTPHTFHYCFWCDEDFSVHDCSPLYIIQIQSIDKHNEYLKSKHFGSFKLNYYYYFTIFYLKLVFPIINCLFHFVLHCPH